MLDGVSTAHVIGQDTSSRTTATISGNSNRLATHSNSADPPLTWAWRSDGPTLQVLGRRLRPDTTHSMRFSSTLGRSSLGTDVERVSRRIEGRMGVCRFGKYIHKYLLKGSFYLGPLLTLSLDKALANDQFFRFRRTPSRPSRRIARIFQLPDGNNSSATFQLPPGPDEWLCPYFDPLTRSLRFRRRDGHDIDEHYEAALLAQVEDVLSPRDILEHICSVRRLAWGAIYGRAYVRGTTKHLQPCSSKALKAKSMTSRHAASARLHTNPTMHRTWTIPELVFIVLDCLERRDHVELLRVCSLFWELCAPLVWQKVDLSVVKDLFDIDSK